MQAPDDALAAEFRSRNVTLCAPGCLLADFLHGEDHVPGVMAVTQRPHVIVEIGGLPIRLCCDDPAFLRLAQKRYEGYLGTSDAADFEFDIHLAPPDTEPGDEDALVTWDCGRWLMQRGDFRAEWNPSTLRGHIKQTINPYSLDSVLRIVHSLLLARKGGFLLHASSAIRNGRAFIFAGLSGAGKTTMARLAPPDTAMLTDEISYLVRQDSGYFAIGTPFFGALARAGENLRAPVEALYLLAKGPENRIEPVTGVDAFRGLMQNILFFAREPEFVKMVFDAAFDFVAHVPVYRLTFVPDSRVWELIV